MRVVLLTRRFGGEVGATTSRLRAYVSALGEEGAEVTVLTRFPFVYRTHSRSETCRAPVLPGAH